MMNNRVGRSSKLRRPRVIEKEVEKVNTTLDLFSTKRAFSMANNTKFNKVKETKLAEKRDEELERVSSIPESSSDLIVITKMKKLGAYIIAITEKSPAKFRGVFVNRMQNFCLDALQYMLKANFIRQDNFENKKLRENYQTDAIIKLKMLGYIAMVAENAGCILPRQYKQISTQVADVINLAAAWRKSDEEKWRNKIQDIESKGSL